MMVDLASEIKGRLTAQEVFEFYGFQPDRSGFLQCPLHQGDRHGSLKVYEGGRGWHCFGCGRGGSVIDFVMELFGLSFHEACLKLNEDFRLGLSDRKPSRAVKQRFEPRNERGLERIPPIYTEAVNRLPYLEHWLDEHLGAGERKK